MTEEEYIKTRDAQRLWTALDLLNDCSDWPEKEQAFRILRAQLINTLREIEVEGEELEKSEIVR
jgi:hypothetical protein